MEIYTLSEKERERGDEQGMRTEQALELSLFGCF